MLDNPQVKKLVPVLVGAVLAFVVYLVPEAKPIACGMAFGLPLLGGGT